MKHSSIRRMSARFPKLKLSLCLIGVLTIGSGPLPAKRWDFSDFSGRYKGRSIQFLPDSGNSNSGTSQQLFTAWKRGRAARLSVFSTIAGEKIENEFRFFPTGISNAQKVFPLNYGPDPGSGHYSANNHRINVTYANKYSQEGHAEVTLRKTGSRLFLRTVHSFYLSTGEFLYRITYDGSRTLEKSAR